MFERQLSCRIVFQKRRPRDKALLQSAVVGSDINTLAMSWTACAWGIAGIEIAAVFACCQAVSQHVFAYLIAGSSGAAWPKGYKHADGGLYDGEWSAREKDGLGVYRYPSGAQYEGWWRGNVKHGRGVYRYVDGGMFEGEFIKGERSGLGVRTWPGGEVKVCSCDRCQRRHDATIAMSTA
jgi:hypothetical protein